MRLSVVAAMVLATCAWSASACAGVIQGTLWMGPHVGGARTPDPRHQHGVGEAVIYLEHVPEKVERSLTTRRFLFFRIRIPARVLTMVQRQHFEPRVAGVAAGTPVAFVNLDRVYHNVFSVSPACRFDIGKYAPGERDTVLFPHAGVVNLHCDIHPDELGYVVVTPNHAFTRPDSLGRFSLPKLPAGWYTVRAFVPGRPDIVRKVEMPKHGDLALDLGE